MRSSVATSCLFLQVAFAAPVKQNPSTLHARSMLISGPLEPLDTSSPYYCATDGPDACSTFEKIVKMAQKVKDTHTDGLYKELDFELRFLEAADIVLDLEAEGNEEGPYTEKEKTAMEEVADEAIDFAALPVGGGSWVSQMNLALTTAEQNGFFHTAAIEPDESKYNMKYLQNEKLQKLKNHK